MTLVDAGRLSADRARSPAARLREALLAERDRWPLWLPVLFGLGIALYFGLTAEPAGGLGAVAAAALLLGLVAARRSSALAALLIAAAMVAAGFAVAQWRTERVAAPVLEARLGPSPLEGRVRAVVRTASGHRLVLDQIAIAGVPAAPLPDKVRLSVRGAADPGLVPGQRIQLRAMLRPIAPPSAPGGFDFQRYLYFAGIGAVGNGFLPLTVLPPPPGEEPELAIRVARLRATITTKVLAVLPGDVGAVAAALIAGDESKISSAMHQAYRDSGLAHLLSISGLHIAIVAGFVMFLMRASLAACAPVAVRFPIKKWAALVALLAAGAYAVLAGWTVPTQRSFLMMALVLVALMIDRSAISLRVVAWSAIVVLGFLPEALLSPSFQMSYAAVIALIAGYEVAQPHIARWRALGGWWRFAALYVAGLVFSSLLATAATAPFGAFHFNRIALFGLWANMVAVPLSAVLVMPAGLIGVLLMPVGGEALGLVPMGWGIALINWVAVEIASWPGAVVKVPAFPIEALAAIALGGLWICLWRGRWRWGGLAVVAAGCVAAVLARPPDLLVSPDGKLVAITTDGTLKLVGAKGQRFTAETWMARFAEDQPAELGVGESDGARCDEVGCIHKTGRHTIALVRDPRALAEDCRVATIVIASVPVRGRCPSAELVIDRFDLWRQGAHALWLGADRVQVETVRDHRGVRPWALAPEQVAAARRQRVASSGAADRSGGPAP